MKTAHDNPNIARMIYEAPTSAPSSPSGVTIDHIAVMIRDLGTEIREQRSGIRKQRSEQSSEFREMIREWREMEDRMVNALDTRFNALSNNIAGTSEKKKEYTEYETEKDFLDAKSDDGKYDKVEIRNRTVTETETLSLVPDFGKDAKENGNEGEVNGQDPKPEENKINDDDDEVQQDTLESGNRTVNEVLEPVDTLEMRKRNRTVNEIFSPVDDTLESGNRTVNEVLEPKENPKPEENKINDDDDRTVNEIFSPVADLGQDTRNETEKKDTGDPKPKEIRDQGGGWGLEWG